MAAIKKRKAQAVIRQAAPFLFGLLLFDSSGRTCTCACSTFYTSSSVDVVFSIACRDCSNWTFSFASTAHASVITYAILFSSFYNEIQNSKLCSFENILIQKTSEYKYKIKYQICIKRPILEKIKTGLHILPFGLIITTLTVGTLCFITKGGYIYGSTGYRKDYDRRTASDR